MSLELERVFPKLRNSSSFKLTSPKDGLYNCIAWAAEDPNHFWWPDRYWPRKVSGKVEIESFKAAFEKLGYIETGDRSVQPGFQKIAIFARDGAPKHAARQLESGIWTSKMGSHEDICHALEDLEGDFYGVVILIMERPTLKASKQKGQKSPQ